MMTKKRRWILGVVGALLLVLYLITWALGVPAMHNEVASQLVLAWRQTQDPTRAHPKTVQPRCEFGPAFAVFPGLIVSQAHWQTSPEAGERGWSLYLWYGFGMKRLWFRGAMI
jgi:hypothetical protein